MRGDDMNDAATKGSWVEEVKKNAGTLVFLGILTVVFGALAVGSPLITGLAVSMFVGGLLVVAGIVRVVEALKSGQLGAGILGSVLGLLTLVCGVLMLFRPLIGLATLTLVMAVYFLVDGITEIVVAFKMKPEKGWGWMLFGGIVALLLGIFIWRQWPLSGAWAVGTLVGIHLLLSGWTMIMTGSAARAGTSVVQEAIDGEE